VQVDKAERILLHLEKELSSMKAHYMEIQANDDYVHFTGDRNEDPDVNNAIGISSPFIEEPRNQSLCWDATDWDLITEISSCISPDGIDEERMRGIEKAVRRTKRVEIVNLYEKLSSLHCLGSIEDFTTESLSPDIDTDDIRTLEHRLLQLQDEAKHLDQLVHVVSIAGVCSRLLIAFALLKYLVDTLKHGTRGNLYDDVEEAIEPISKVFPQVHELWIEVKRLRSPRRIEPQQHVLPSEEHQSNGQTDVNYTYEQSVDRV